MAAQQYIVVNGAGLYVRSKPDTGTGQILRKMTMGEAFIAHDVFIVDGNKTWARLSQGDSVQQQYCMIEYLGRPAYARLQGPAQSPSPIPPLPSGILETRVAALEAWARSQGFKG